MNVKQWLIQLAIAFDQLANVLVTPFSSSAWADETLSSRAYRAWRSEKFFGFCMVIIDKLFFWQEVPEGTIGHCQNAYLREKERGHLPPEFREL